MNKLINLYEDIMVNYFQKKYDKLINKIYKFSKISYRLKIKYRSKINNCKITKEEKRDITNYWKEYTNDFKIYANMFYVDENGKKDSRFIPDDLYAEYIEKYFNNAKLSPAFSDKNYFDLILNGYKMPESYIHYISNSFLDKNYNIISKEEAYKILLKKKELVIKRSIGTSGGAGVTILDKVSKDILDNIFNNNENRNLIIQERIKQCDILNNFSKNSINTIRIYTYWYNNTIYATNAVLRVGKGESKTDNASSGGVFFHIDAEDNLVKIPRTIDGLVDSTYKFNNKLKGNINFSFMNDIRKYVKSAATRLPHFKIIAWDIAITRNYEPILIEYNIANTIPDINQMFRKPFFGEHTEDILREVFNNIDVKKDGLFTDQYI